MSTIKMEVDFRKLQERLTIGFLHREFQIINPQMTSDYLEQATKRYKTDPIFHARVDSIVASVLDIVETHNHEPKEPTLKIV